MKDIGLNITYFKNHEDIISRARNSGVSNFLFTGTKPETNRQSLLLAEEYGCRSTWGIHPCACNTYDGNIESFYQSAKNPLVASIGECGLDYYRMISTPDIQKEILDIQLSIAKKVNKPVFLHLRSENDGESQIIQDFMDVYRKYENPGVVHCFTGNRYMLDALLECGLSIGITGWISDRRGQGLVDIIKAVPDGRLMIETDAPYLTPRNMPKHLYRRENEPAFLPWVLEAVAGYREQSIAHVESVTDKNTLNMFDI